MINKNQEMISVNRFLVFLQLVRSFFIVIFC
ncbi:hypothetical protein CJA_0527 [Cellvibrio japonicus Ueda107]|uniref:Uncharacterized protein n=1 Tax=Cellvibrio japonicus (strain Ueda107) TaxID=498211 RepID=B3PJ15_CELJU|nr:hypothetical protein CJA_0527 [Cellvibrio japonicus Ueda107]